MRKIALLSASGIALVALGSWYFYGGFASFPPKGNVCYDMARDALDAVRSRDGVVVPDFVPSQVSYMRCGVVPGFIHFEIAGTDTTGAPFHIYETSGGRAASGGDSILDYCYTKGDAMVSGMRMTGRDGDSSEPSCAYDKGYLIDATDTYSFGSP